MNFPQVSAFGFSGPDLAGGYVGKQWDRHDAAQAQSWNMYNMERAQEFQRYMRSTAYQATVDDLEAAGLNPMLAYSQGPTSTPGAVAFAGPQAAATHFPGVGGSESFQTGAQTGLLEAQTRATRQQELKTMVDRMVEEWELAFRQSEGEEEGFRYQALREAQMKMAQFDAMLTEADARMAQELLKGKLVEGEIDETTYGAVMRYIDRAMRSLSGGTSAFGRMRR